MLIVLDNPLDIKLGYIPQTEVNDQQRKDHDK